MNQQLSQIIREPAGEFKNFTRMSYADFKYLLNEISPVTSKQDTHMRLAVTARVQLGITSISRHLTTDTSVQFLFKVSA